MYDKILAPLDGSELAEVTLWYAARLAVRLRAALTLVYVSSHDEIASPYMHECYLKYTVDRVKTEAGKIATETKGGDIIVDYSMLKGDPAEEIVDYADKNKIDLIILSTQGKSGIRRWALGNVANKVVAATRKQVLLIRAKGAQPDVYKDSLVKVLVPVDGSRESESILRFVTYMAAELGLEITLFHMSIRGFESYPSMDMLRIAEKIRKHEKAYVEKLGKKLTAQGLHVDTVFNEVSQGEEAAEIIRLAEEGHFSMVAMATHGRSGFGRWIFGSNAQKVLNEGSTPLLLVRPIKGKKRNPASGR
jgi:nucleotide-binding universal stress UspA family protein